MIMIQPFDAYSYYMSIKLHFERDSYDALKYNFKSSATQKSFMVRKDKYHFAKISKKFVDSKELVAYYVSNFVRGSKWVGGMLEHGDENYSAWKRYSDSMTYRFTSDVDVLVDYIDSKKLKFDDLFLITEDGGSHPPIIRLLLQEDVSLETVVLLDKMLGFTKRFDKTITETLVWPDLSMRIRKYKPFVNADLEALKKIVRNKFA